MRPISFSYVNTRKLSLQNKSDIQKMSYRTVSENLNPRLSAQGHVFKPNFGTTFSFLTESTWSLACAPAVQVKYFP